MMNLNETVTLLQIEQGMPLVDVRFLDDTRGEDNPGAIYTYKAAAAPHLKVGDLAVVEARDTFSLARVVAIVGPEVLHQRNRPLDKLRHVVAKVDRDHYGEVMAAEQKVRQTLAMAEVNDRLASVRRFIPQNLRALPEPPIEALVEEEEELPRRPYGYPRIYPVSIGPTVTGGPVVIRYTVDGPSQAIQGATLYEYETPYGRYSGSGREGWTLEQWGTNRELPAGTKVKLGTEWFELARGLTALFAVEGAV